MKNLFKLGYTSVILVLGVHLSVDAQSFINPLYIPSTLSGTQIPLTVQNGTMSFYPGFQTASIGFNGNYLGPTLICNKGDSLSILVQNTLSDTTTVHWHGMHVSARNDGGPHVVIPPATSWNPRFKVLDAASTHWYHSHLHMRTAEQVTKGMAGMIIVRDSIENSLTLPRNYGVDDIPMVFQSRAFDANKQFIVDTALDSVLLINGTKNPFVQLPAQIVRLRLLNGSTMRSYNFGLSTNAVFHMIASDGGLLNAPVPLSRLLLSPGERAEILLNLSGLQGQSVFLTNYGSEIPNGIYGAANPAAMGMGTIPNYANNALNGSNTNLLRIDIISPTANPVTTLPSTLTVLSPWNPATSNITRNLTFAPVSMGGGGGLNGPFAINSTPFDMMTINYTIPLNNVEIWSLTNNSPIAHPFHIHNVPFYILDINNVAPAPALSGKKDVVLVRSQQTVRFITRFTDFADEMYPYMYHCHMLVHEDDGMMGQYLVIDTSVDLKETLSETDRLSIYPNPASSTIYLQWNSALREQFKLRLYNIQGVLIHYENLSFNSQVPLRLDLSFLQEGLYTLELQNQSGLIIHKKVLLGH